MRGIMKKKSVKSNNKMSENFRDRFTAIFWRFMQGRAFVMWLFYLKRR